MFNKLSIFICIFVLCTFMFCPKNFAFAVTTYINDPQNGDVETPEITELPVLMDLPAADEVALGQKYTFKGTISAKSKLTKVTLIVEGAGQLVTVEPGNTSFNLNNITVNTPGDILSKPGTYTVNVWAKSEDYTNPKRPLGQMKLVVTGITPKTEQQTVKLLQPNDKGFLEVGDAITLSAEAIGVDCVKFYAINTSTGKFEDPIVKTYTTNLSSEDWLPGRYLVLAVGYSGSAQELIDDTAYFTLNAKTPEITELPVLMNLPAADEVALGQKYTFKGTISAKTKLTKVTLLAAGAGQLATVEPGNTSFNLNNITVNTTGDILSKPGTYTVNVWAKSEDYTNPDKPIGQMKLTVKEVPKPQFDVTVNNNQPIIQGDIALIKVTDLKSPAGVKAIQYFVVKNGIPYEKTPKNSADQTLEWDTGGTAVGRYIFKVIVTDTNGQTGEMQQPVEILAKPVLDKFPYNKTVEVKLGDKYTFEGKISSSTNLQVVNLVVYNEQNGKEFNNKFKKEVSGTKFDLNKFIFNTKDTGFNIPGTYDVKVWIRDINGYTNKLGQMKIEVVGQKVDKITSSPYPLRSINLKTFGQFDYREDSGGRIKIDPTWVSKNIETITLPGINKKVEVHRLAKNAFMDAFNKIAADPDLLKLVSTIDGTFVARHVNWVPSRGLSRHSWGIAIDINAGTHPMGTPAGEDAPNRILWEEAFKPAGFVWGGNWSGADVDPMHFQLGN